MRFQLVVATIGAFTYCASAASTNYTTMDLSYTFNDRSAILSSNNQEIYKFTLGYDTTDGISFNLNGLQDTGDVRTITASPNGLLSTADAKGRIIRGQYWGDNTLHWFDGGISPDMRCNITMDGKAATSTCTSVSDKKVIAGLNLGANSLGTFTASQSSDDNISFWMGMLLLNDKAQHPPTTQ